MTRNDRTNAGLALLLLAATYAVAAGLDVMFPASPIDCATLTDLHLYPPPECAP